ncbi:darobactin maturation radical SAM/SPASM protein DarE [Sodalis sp. RH21]|uniref:darobactin maturation radical SAM/SPASM protein DarE n=1 Tax=unclassified Sodalis (in: enterobacteria) TaxID=2636512 RepID=UPI0039B43E39
MKGLIPVTSIDGSSIDGVSMQDLRQLAFNDYRQLSASLIGRIPAENLLNEDEIKTYHHELAQEILAPPIDAARLVVVVKATRLCNLRCTYCHSWAEGPNQTLTFRNLIRCVRRLLAIPNITRFEFVWHGGEVTLLKPDFFKKLIWLQEQFKRPGQRITNSMQSNAVNISDEWLLFIKGIGMSVGISLDGIPGVNDTRRVDYRGRGTSERVARSIGRLRRYEIAYGALIVVDRAIFHTDIRNMFDYFISIELRDIEFLNIVPDNRTPPGGDIGPSYISYGEFITFLSVAFVIWWHDYRHSLRIPLFADFIKVLTKPDTRLSACYWAGNCSQEVITLEPNGDVSPCDKYVGDAGGRYGSLLSTDLAQLLARSRHNRLALAEEKAAAEKMRDCPWFALCRGGCPHDRVINRRHVPGYDDTCCGTGKLLGIIRDCLASEGRPS